MNGRTLAAAAAALALALPASAAASNTFTVDPGAAEGCNASHVCKSLTDAVNDVALASGDQIVINDGAYSEPGTIAVTTPGVLIKALNPLKVSITQVAGPPSLGIPVISLVEGDRLDGIIVNSAADSGGPAVLIKGINTTVSRSILTKTGTSTQDTPVYEVLPKGDGGPDGGINNINHTSVLSAPTASAAQLSATIAGDAGSSMSLDSVIAFSGQMQGPAVSLPGNDQTAGGVAVPNKVVASVLGAVNVGESALRVTSAASDTTPKSTVIDSSVLNGGAAGQGLYVQSETSGTKGTDSSGNISVIAVHTTIAGVKFPFIVNAMSSGLSAAKGSINVTFDRSIIHGTAQGTVSSASGNNIPILSPGVPNTAHVIVQDSDTTQAEQGVGGPASIAVTATTKTPDQDLFVNPTLLNFHLKGTAPVIDKGGPQGVGESTVDFDGDARVVGNASDLGADEFVNHAPTASATVNPVVAKQGQAITYDASASSDPDGGGVAQYVWNFADGSSVTTTTPVVQHSFVLLGDYNGSLTVIDPSGAASSAFQLPHIHITDGSPPGIVITSPKAGKSFKIYTVTTRTTTSKSGKKTKKTTKKFNKITFTGSAVDEAGIGYVELQVRRLNLPGKTANPKTCVTTDGKHPLTVTSCKTPQFFRVSFKDGKFSYTLKAGQKLKPGSYQLSARATDKNGNTSAPAVVKFTLK